MGKPNVNVVIGANQKTESAYKTIVLKGGLSFASQLTDANAKYVVKYDFDLGKERVTMPEDSIVSFDGGRLYNGKVVLNNTVIEGTGGFGDSIDLSGTCGNDTAYQNWFENDNVDSWIKFINNVKGVTSYSFSAGSFTPTEYISKEADNGDFVNFIGNGCKLEYEAINVTTPYITIKPREITDGVYPLPSQVMKGDGGIDVQDGTKFKRGDYAVIHDGALSSFNPARDYEQGEIIKIEKVVDNRVVPDHYVYGNYTHNENAYDENDVLQQGNFLTIAKINLIKVSVKDLELRLVPTLDMSYRTVGAEVYNAIADFDSFDVYNFRYAVKIDTCLNSNIRNCRVTCTREVGNSSDTYGMQIIGCQNVNVEGCTAYGGRHAYAISSHYKGETSAVSRFITLNGCYGIGYRGRVGFNCHGGAECVNFVNCTADGIDIGANNCRVENCVVTNNLHSFNLLCFNYTIANNDIGGEILVARYVGDDHDFTFKNYVIEDTPELCVIKDNTVGGKINIYDDYLAPYNRNLKNTKFIVKGNNIGENIVATVGGGWRAPYLEYPNWDSSLDDFADIDISNNSFKINTAGTSDTLIIARHARIANNEIYVNESGRMNLYVKEGFIDNNVITLDSAREAGNAAVFRNDKCHMLRCSGNRVINGVTPLLGGYNDLRPSVGIVHMLDNIADKLSYYAFPEDCNTLKIYAYNNSASPKGNNCAIVEAVGLTKYEDSYKSMGYVGVDDKGNPVALLPNATKGLSTNQLVEAAFVVSNNSSRTFKVSYDDDTTYRAINLQAVLTRVDGGSSMDFVLHINNSGINVEYEKFFTKDLSHNPQVIPSVYYKLDRDNNCVYVKIVNNMDYSCSLALRETSKNTQVGKIYLEQVEEPEGMSAATVAGTSSVIVTDTTPTSTNGAIGEQRLLSSTKSVVTFDGTKWVEFDGAAAGVARSGSSSARPAAASIYSGFKYFDTTLERVVTWDGNSWVGEDGLAIGTAKSGPTSQRPAGGDIYIGFEYLDTDLDKLIIAKDIDGSDVSWIESDSATAGVRRKGTTAQRPESEDIYESFKYQDTTIEKAISWDGEKWIEEDGATAGVKRRGTTAERPDAADIYVGFVYYDTDINMPIYAYLVDTDNDHVYWTDFLGVNPSVSHIGTYVQKPSGADVYIGFLYYATDLYRNIVWRGDKWTNVDGTDISFYPTVGNSKTLVDEDVFDYKDVPVNFEFYAADLGKTLHFGKIVSEDSSYSIPTDTKVLLIQNPFQDFKRYTFRASNKHIKLYMTNSATPAPEDLILMASSDSYSEYIDFVAFGIVRDYTYVYLVDEREGENLEASKVWFSLVDTRWFEEDGVVAVYEDENYNVFYTRRSGTFANKPTVADNAVYVGFRYFCTDKQTTEGATNGIEIIHKGSDVWVDALGRVVE